jgi:hypothetical protein
VQGAGRGGGGIFMERNNGGRAAAAVWALWLGVPRFRNLDPFGIMAAGLDPTVHDTLPLVARLAARVARPSDAPCRPARTPVLWPHLNPYLHTQHLIIFVASFIHV